MTMFDSNPVSDAEAMARLRLEHSGYCVLRDIAPQADLARIDAELAAEFDQTPFCRGDFYGVRTKRLGRLLIRSPSVADLVLHPMVRNLAEWVLRPHCDMIQLNVGQAIEIHPGALSQYPHRDQDMYWGEKGKIEYLVNIMWPLTPFTLANGATMVWPGSHGARALQPVRDNEPISAEIRPGDALVFLGSTLHAAGSNATRAARRGIVIGYSLGWLKPYENASLAYPPAIARQFAPEFAALLDYRQHRPNLGNFEGQCPSILLEEEVPDRLEAIDALREEDEADLAEFVAGQRRVSDRHGMEPGHR